MPKDLEPACLYLRKSREDREAEARGEGETLAKHKKALFKLAQEKNVAITKVFEEIESGGERIIHRPGMLKLLQEVADGKWRSVFCMEIDRLGRGRQQDQGLIQDTFKDAGCVIVTPRKTYDLNDEFDEEYVEFEGFMARKELKIITRRMQGGRRRSAEEGNYLGARPPYGYLIKTDGRERYLIPHPDQATVVRLIFSLYITGMGGRKIATELNRLGHKTYTGKPWESSAVLFIIKNEVYSGRLQWGKKAVKKSADGGKIVHSRPRADWINVQGKHVPLIDDTTFAQAQEILKHKYHVPYQLTAGIVNPLAGVVYCDMCGGSMVRRPYTKQRAHLICYNPRCPNKSTRFEYVEDELVKHLADWLRRYKAAWNEHPRPEQDTLIAVKEKMRQALAKEMRKLEHQRDMLHDLLEKGIYDAATYRERSSKLAAKILETAAAVSAAEKQLAEEQSRVATRKDIIPKVEQILQLYTKDAPAHAKNKLLKAVLERATYRKEPGQTNDDFALFLSPRLPK